VHYPRYAAQNDPSLDRDDGMTANPWPSSDWAAIVAEHGIPASVCLVLAIIGLAVGALFALARARSAEDLLRPIVLIATLAATLVVGAFDAVLLLPAPALIAWGLFGALAPPAKVRHDIELAGSRRGWLVIGMFAVGALASLHSAAQLAAMSIYDPDGRPTTMARAARLDPGSYRIQIRLAEVHAHRGRCNSVRQYAGHAHDLFPNAPEPKRPWRGAVCGSGGHRPSTGPAYPAGRSHTMGAGSCGPAYLAV
jgi:hypothetical protein